MCVCVVATAPHHTAFFLLNPTPCDAVAHVAAALPPYRPSPPRRAAAALSPAPLFFPSTCSKCLDKKITKVEDLPIWNYDGSSTGQAPGHDSEVLLK